MATMPVMRRALAKLDSGFDETDSDDYCECAPFSKNSTANSLKVLSLKKILSPIPSTTTKTKLGTTPSIGRSITGIKEEQILVLLCARLNKQT